MVSEKQLAANRRNALKSTGPRSAHGKRIASQNARTHGLTAEQVVAVEEDARRLEEFAADLRRELMPGGAMQEMLFERIVVLSWRLKRIAAAEQAAIDRGAEISDPASGEAMRGDASPGETARGEVSPRRGRPSAADVLIDELAGNTTSVLERLQLYEMRTERGLKYALREFAALQQRAARIHYVESEENLPAKSFQPEQAPTAPTPSPTPHCDVEKTNPFPPAQAEPNVDPPPAARQQPDIPAAGHPPHHHNLLPERIL